MGKGQRHSKNAGTMGSEALRYHERRALGFGTVKERLGKDSLGNFDDCCLTLQPVKDPVITPGGFLYSKEAILENLLQQKKAIKRKLAAYEAAQDTAARKVAEQEAITQHAEVIAFDRANHMGIQDKTVDSIKAAISSEAAAAQTQQGATSVMNIKENEERLKSLKAFWMPSKAPEAETTLEKPSTDTLCPASGKKLRMKDLIPVHFTPVPEGADGHYMDPITKVSQDVVFEADEERTTAGRARRTQGYLGGITLTADALTNHSKLVVIKTTGDVVLKETYSKLIKPDGVMNGKKVRESDVVELQTGGTGFSARDGERAQSSKYAQLGVGSGRQQLRGQQGLGASSLGGLKLMN